MEVCGTGSNIFKNRTSSLAKCSVKLIAKSVDVDQTSLKDEKDKD
jgi:hypothetical protein